MPFAMPDPRQMGAMPGYMGGPPSGLNVPGGPGGLGDPGFGASGGIDQEEMRRRRQEDEERMRREEQQRRIEAEQARRQQMREQRTQQRDSMVERPLTYGGNERLTQPINLDANLVEGGVESLGGTLSLPIDRSQRLRVGGVYMPGYSEDGMPVPSSYRIEAGYQTPGINVNVNYRGRRRGSGGMGDSGGLGAMVQGNMNW